MGPHLFAVAVVSASAVSFTMATAVVTFFMASAFMVFPVATTTVIVSVASAFMIFSMASAAVIVVVVSAAASFVMMSAATFMVPSATSVMVVPATAATAVAVYEFTVQTFLEFLFGGLAHCKDFSGEIQCLACHRGVEVHLYAGFTDFKDYTGHDSACTVEEWDCVADHEKVFPDFSVYLECFFGKVYDSVRVMFAVSFLRGEGE